MVKDFKFNIIGLEFSKLTSVMSLNKGYEPEEGLFIKTIVPDSIAQEVGIDANDVIVAINDEPISTRFEFEMAFFKAMKKPEAQFKIWRKDEGYKDIQVTMEKSTEIPDKKIAQKTKEAQSVAGFAISFSYKTAKGPKKKDDSSN